MMPFPDDEGGNLTVKTTLPGMMLRNSDELVTRPMAPTARVRDSSNLIDQLGHAGHANPAFTHGHGRGAIYETFSATNDGRFQPLGLTVTTPMSLSSFSRMGPCSMCSSKNARILRAPLLHHRITGAGSSP
jgi:hypothetical protein